VKAGMLVTLSKYGKDRVQNNSVTSYTDNPIGMVTKVKERRAYPFVVKWINIPGFYNGSIDWQDCYSRRELKYAGR